MFGEMFNFHCSYRSYTPFFLRHSINLILASSPPVPHYPFKTIKSIHPTSNKRHLSQSELFGNWAERRQRIENGKHWNVVGDGVREQSTISIRIQYALPIPICSYSSRKPFLLFIINSLPFPWVSSLSQDPASNCRFIHHMISIYHISSHTTAANQLPAPPSLPQPPGPPIPHQRPHAPFRSVLKNGKTARNVGRVGRSPRQPKNKIHTSTIVTLLFSC